MNDVEFYVFVGTTVYILLPIYYLISWFFQVLYRYIYGHAVEYHSHFGFSQHIRTFLFKLYVGYDDNVLQVTAERTGHLWLRVGLPLGVPGTAGRLNYTRLTESK